DAPVSKAELQRRVEAFADAEGLDDDGCRAALKRYAARDADGCVRFLRAAPGDVGKVPVDKRSAFVMSAIKAEYLLAASASELEALAPELRRVADALALTSDVARALKALSRVDQRRVAERLADPGGLLFGMLSRNGWIRADLSKGKTGNLLQEKLWRPSVDAALVAALDGRRLSNHCYRALRDLDPERQALCALALEAADLSKLTDLSGYIEKGLEKGTLLRKGQELMDARPSEAPRSEAPRPAPLPRDEDDAPEEFLCPISMEVMQDPVIAADGHTYERRAIEAWFERAQTSPTTNEPLPHVNLIPNHTIRSMINRGSRF
ncbi:ubiquitin-protein transferase, partial [Aureococcus anophagefferens]